MNEYRIIYPELSFVVDYSHEEKEPRVCLNVTAWQLTEMVITGASSFAPDEDQEPHLTGAVRFDGCANFSFDPCVHFCGVEMARQHAQLLEEIYKEHQKLFPDYK
jgi:hypothetical protein